MLIVPLFTVILLPIFTPPRVELVAFGSVYFVSVVGGVYPSAVVTLVLLMLIVPLLTVIVLPIFTPPRVELVAAGSV